MEIFGYRFANEALLEQALTTASYRMRDPKAADNQRLEFLGDAVLQMLATEYVFARHPHEHEGKLTARRKHMVSTQALVKAAGSTDLVSRLRMSPEDSQQLKSGKVVADAVEAVLGAVWLDGGSEAARKVFAYLQLVEDASPSEWADNSKGELQVHTQAMKPPRQPKYELVKTEGKSHDPLFTVKVAVEGVGEATGQGRTKKEAESEAARKLLNEINSLAERKGKVR